MPVRSLLDLLPVRRHCGILCDVSSVLQRRLSTTRLLVYFPVPSLSRSFTFQFRFPVIDSQLQLSDPNAVFSPSVLLIFLFFFIHFPLPLFPLSSVFLPPSSSSTCPSPAFSPRITIGISALAIAQGCGHSAAELLLWRRVT